MRIHYDNLYPEEVVKFVGKIKNYDKKRYKEILSYISYDIKGVLTTEENNDKIVLLKRSIERYNNSQLNKCYSSVIYVLQAKKNYKSMLLSRKIYRLNNEYDYHFQYKEISDYYVDESHISPKINEWEDDLIIPEKKILVVKNGYNETSRIELPIAHDKITINGAIV